MRVCSVALEILGHLATNHKRCLQPPKKRSPKKSRSQHVRGPPLLFSFLLCTRVCAFSPFVLSLSISLSVSEKESQSAFVWPAFPLDFPSLYACMCTLTICAFSLYQSLCLTLSVCVEDIHADRCVCTHIDLPNARNCYILRASELLHRTYHVPAHTDHVPRLNRHCSCCLIATSFKFLPTQIMCLTVLTLLLPLALVAGCQNDHRHRACLCSCLCVPITCLTVSIHLIRSEQHCQRTHLRRRPGATSPRIASNQNRQRRTAKRCRHRPTLPS